MRDCNIKELTVTTLTHVVKKYNNAPRTLFILSINLIIIVDSAALVHRKPTQFAAGFACISNYK